MGGSSATSGPPGHGCAFSLRHLYRGVAGNFREDVGVSDGRPVRYRVAIEGVSGRALGQLAGKGRWERRDVGDHAGHVVG